VPCALQEHRTNARIYGLVSERSPTSRQLPIGSEELIFSSFYRVIVKDYHCDGIETCPKGGARFTARMLLA
jgi:hypothetical protein